MYQAESSAALFKKEYGLPRSRLAWLNVGPTVFLLGTTSLLSDIASEMVTTTLPLYLLLSLRLSPFQVGLTDGIYQGAAVLMRVISGMVADRSRRAKQVAAAGYGLSAISRLALLAAGSSWTAISGIILVDRVGKGIRTAPRDAIIASSSQPGQLATAFGVHRAMDTAGAMLGPLLAVAILTFTQQGYDAIFVVSFCIALVGVAVIVLFVDNPSTSASDGVGEAESSSPAAPAVTVRRMLGLLWEPNFRVLLTAGTALALVTVSDSLLYLALEERIAIAPGVFPLLYVGTALAFMIFAIPAGRLADRLGAETVFLFGYGLLAVVYGLLLLPWMDPFLAVLMLMALGGYYAATDGVLMASASRMLPSDLRATGLALLTTGLGVGRALASALYGMVWGSYGTGWALSASAAGLVIALWSARRSLRRVHAS